jgi:predicted pyridoxine 5'-phosphate oxidase superfamily flavin-nucleotide-binding protein
MPKLTPEIVQFLEKQGFVIVSTIDKDGRPHSSCKGIIKINADGQIYLLDLYLAQTYENLKRNPNLSITAVDEREFKGWCLKGKAKIILAQDLKAEIKKDWEEKITSRITQRVLKNLREEKGHPHHPEAFLPGPKYLVQMQVEGIVDLIPLHLKTKP